MIEENKRRNRTVNKVKKMTLIEINLFRKNLFITPRPMEEEKPSKTKTRENKKKSKQTIKVNY